MVNKVYIHKCWEIHTILQTRKKIKQISIADYPFLLPKLIVEAILCRFPDIFYAVKMSDLVQTQTRIVTQSGNSLYVPLCNFFSSPNTTPANFGSFRPASCHSRPPRVATVHSFIPQMFHALCVPDMKGRKSFAMLGVPRFPSQFLNCYVLFPLFN